MTHTQTHRVRIKSVRFKRKCSSRFLPEFNAMTSKLVRAVGK